MRNKRILALAAVAAFGLIAAACGDDDSGGSAATTTAAAAATTKAPDTTKPAETTTAAGATTTAASTATTTAELKGLALAKARAEEFKKKPTDIGITESVKVPEKPKIAYVQCAVPVCQSIRGIEAAAKAIGADFEAFPTQDTADTVKAAFQSAIQSNPTMVMTSGNPREWFEEELKTLNDKKIPVVAWSMPEGYTPDGLAANLITGGDYFFNGVLMADYVTDKTDGKANVLFLNIPQFPVLAEEQKGFEQEFAEVCPDCKLTKQEFTVPQLLAGEHIAAAVSALQKDKDINFIVTGFGDMLIGMPDALKNAGFDNIPAVSQAGTPANYALIEGGQLQVADMGLPTEYLGWRAVDAGLRALAGQSPGTFPARPLTDVANATDVQIAGLPFMILEKGDVADPTKAWPGVDGYQDQFLKLWGVG